MKFGLGSLIKIRRTISFRLVSFISPASDGPQTQFYKRIHVEMSHHTIITENDKIKTHNLVNIHINVILNLLYMGLCLSKQ